MRISCISLLCFISVGVLAGEQTGKVASLLARVSDGLHLVDLSGGTEKSNSPACATHKYWLIKDESSTTGKSQFSQLLAAKMAGSFRVLMQLWYAHQHG